MSVSINPSRSLKFEGPFTERIESSLTIINHNLHPVDFKLKTITPKCCHAAGRIEPGGTVEVPVASQPFPEDVVSQIVFKDALVVESRLAPPKRFFRSFRDTMMRRKKKVHLQKLDVEFLPSPRPIAFRKGEDNESRRSGAEVLDSLNATEMKFRQLKADFEAQKHSKPPLGDLLSIEALRLLTGPGRHRR